MSCFSLVRHIVNRELFALPFAVDQGDNFISRSNPRIIEWKIEQAGTSRRIIGVNLIGSRKTSAFHLFVCQDEVMLFAIDGCAVDRHFLAVVLAGDGRAREQTRRRVCIHRSIV